MAQLHMKVGSNFGEILLDIAQTEIQKGHPNNAFKKYETALEGFTKEHALMCLKNEGVLITDLETGNLNLSTDLKDIENNKHNIIDWRERLFSIIENIDDSIKGIIDCKKFFYRKNIDYNDFDIIGYAKRYNGDHYEDSGIHNILARHLANYKSSGLLGDPEGMWGRMSARVEDGEGFEDEEIYYHLDRYVKIIRYLHHDFMKFNILYDFLLENNMTTHFPYVENTMENVLEILEDFSDTKEGYHHPMCDEVIYKFKETIIKDILKTKIGKEYLQYGIVKKEIMDGYDAGYISPEGDFYGGLGETSSMIHMNLADSLIKKKFFMDYIKTQKIMDIENEKNGFYKSKLDPEQYLHKKGFMKIHHNECYGFYKHYDDDDNSYLYCPTDIQIKMVCNYIDKYYNGKVYTESQILETTDPISTYKLRQMDRIKLHETFE